MSEITSMEILLTIHAGDMEKFDSFLASGLDINTRTEREKWNFLHRALVSVRQTAIPSMIEYLVNHGVDVNARDFHMWTPLHWPRKFFSVKLLGVKLRAGLGIPC